MSVNWYELVETQPQVEAEPDICDLGTTEAMDEVASSMRCLVYYVLPAATLGAIGFFAGLAWLAARTTGG